MARAPASPSRKVLGLGFLPEEARHGFLIDVPKGSVSSEMVCITEHCGNELNHLGARAADAPQPNEPALRVVLDRNRWLALAPEERWWLYTMTEATTGQAMLKGIGWRKALRAALADNPFVKGDGLSPKARRELLGHSQLSLAL
jgi:hypothetical protein